jgi:hypothetical protein
LQGLQFFEIPQHINTQEIAKKQNLGTAPHHFPAKGKNKAKPPHR